MAQTAFALPNLLLHDKRNNLFLQPLKNMGGEYLWRAQLAHWYLFRDAQHGSASSVDKHPTAVDIRNPHKVGGVLQQADESLPLLLGYLDICHIAVDSHQTRNLPLFIFEQGWKGIHNQFTAVFRPLNGPVVKLSRGQENACAFAGGII